MLYSAVSKCPKCFGKNKIIKLFVLLTIIYLPFAKSDRTHSIYNINNNQHLNCFFFQNKKKCKRPILEKEKMREKFENDFFHWAPAIKDDLEINTSRLIYLMVAYYISVTKIL